MKSIKDIYPLYIFFMLFFTGCNMKDYELSKLKQQSISNFNPEFKDYCQLDLTTNFEINAVQSSFFGEYNNTLDQATKNASIVKTHSDNIVGIEKDKLLKEMKESLNDPNASIESKATAKAVIEMITGVKTPEKLLQRLVLYQQ